MSGRRPHHSVIRGPVKISRGAIIAAFIWFPERLDGLGQARFAHVIADGTKMAANAALHNTVTYRDADREIRKPKKRVKKLARLAGSLPGQLGNPGGRVDAAKSLQGKFIADMKEYACHARRIEALEAGWRNPEEEAREPATGEIRRELEQSVLEDFLPDLKAIDRRAVKFKAVKDPTDADYSRLKREVSRRHAERETRRRCRLPERIGRHIAGDWAIVKPEIEAHHNAVCRIQPDSEETSRRAEKLLPPERKPDTTDPDSRVMRRADKSFDMACSSRLAIDKSSNMALCIRVTRDCSDPYRLRPLVGSITADLGPVEKADADCGCQFGHGPEDVPEALGIDLCVPANRPDSEHTRGRWKPGRTEQAGKMEEKLALEGYGRRSGDRKVIESRFGNAKFNDMFLFIHYRGLEKVEAVLTLKCPSQNTESHIRHERRMEEEKRRPGRSRGEIPEAQFAEALDRFNRPLAGRNPRQPSPMPDWLDSRLKSPTFFV